MKFISNEVLFRKADQLNCAYSESPLINLISLNRERD